MSDKQKNLIVRAITGIIFVAVMVLGILHPYSLIVLFAFITGAALWEYTGLVNNIKGVRSTVSSPPSQVSISSCRRQGYGWLLERVSSSSSPMY